MSSNTLYQFAGVKAVGADTNKLRQAVDMFDAGQSEQTILRETGWFRGVDRQWRYEISDHKAHLNYDAIQNLIDAGDYAALPLSSVFKHDDLYAAYPELRDVKFIVRETDDKTVGGWWSDKTKTVCLHKHFLENEEECLNILVHEVQHAIQSIEGFALGGNQSESFNRFLDNRLQDHLFHSKVNLNRWKGENSSAIDKADKAREKAKYGRLFQSYRKMMQYCQHESPSRIKRYIENQCHWLYNPLFREDSGVLGRGVSDLQVHWYNMPKRNDRGQKSEFLSKYAYDVAQMYLQRIPEEFRKEFLLVDVDFKRESERLNRESQKLDVLLADKIPMEDNLRAVENSVDNFNNVMTHSNKPVNPWSPQVKPYHLLAGEVEANNVIHRRKMTDEERRASHFSMTQDVPSYKQIVYFDRETFVSHFVKPQSDVKAPKGSVTFKGDSFAKILLSPDADLSTIVHEGAHVFLEAYSDIANAQPDNNKVQAGFGDIMEWMGTTKEEWFDMDIDARRDLHEEFAEAFEAHVAGGRNSKLDKVFDGFKSWIMDIYSKLSGMPETKPLTKNVEKLFDDMLSGVKPEANNSFIKSITESISVTPNLSKEQAIAGSIIIDSTFEHLSEIAEMPRNDLNTIYNVEVKDGAPKKTSTFKLG